LDDIADFFLTPPTGPQKFIKKKAQLDRIGRRCYKTATSCPSGGGLQTRAPQSLAKTSHRLKTEPSNMKNIPLIIGLTTLSPRERLLRQVSRF